MSAPAFFLIALIFGLASTEVGGLPDIIKLGKSTTQQNTPVSLTSFPVQRMLFWQIERLWNEVNRLKIL